MCAHTDDEAPTIPRRMPHSANHTHMQRFAADDAHANSTSGIIVVPIELVIVSVPMGKSAHNHVSTTTQLATLNTVSLY